MNNDLIILKGLMLEKTNYFRLDAPEEYVMDTPAMEASGEEALNTHLNLVKRISADYGFSPEDAVAFHALTLEINRAVAYTETNINTSTVLEMIPYLQELTYKSCEMLDAACKASGGTNKGSVQKDLQVHSIVSSVTNGAVSRAVAAHKTMFDMHAGIDMLQKTAGSSPKLPDCSGMQSEDILGAFDCGMKCEACVYSDVECVFKRAHDETIREFGFEFVAGNEAGDDAHAPSAEELLTEVSQFGCGPLSIRIAISFAGTDLSDRGLQQITDDLFDACNAVIKENFPSTEQKSDYAGLDEESFAMPYEEPDAERFSESALGSEF